MFEFDTCSDPQLEAMLDAVNAYAAALINRDAEPYWLTLLGSSGVGKSYLAEQLYELAREQHHLCEHPSLINPVKRVLWPDVLAKLRDKKYWIIEELTDCNALFLEDPGAERDPNKFGADGLFRILEGRRNKWTMLTSNATPVEIGERLDMRIISRLRRGANELVIADVLDYSLRTGREFFQKCLLRYPTPDRRRMPLSLRYGLNELLGSEHERWFIPGNGKYERVPDELWEKLWAN